MTWMANIPQWGVIFLLAVRSARIIYADLRIATRERRTACSASC